MENFDWQLVIFGSIAAAVVAVNTDVCKFVIWSMILYLNRGEFNTDGNWDTPDKFLLFSPETGSFLQCYITKYTLSGVYWGFFHPVDNKGGMGYVSKKTYWLHWAATRDNRFPMPQADIENEEELFRVKKGVR